MTTTRTMTKITITKNAMAKLAAMTTTGSMAMIGNTTMTDKENIPAQALIRALNAKLRDEIMREIADLPKADLRGVLRMIETWKGRGNE